MEWRGGGDILLGVGWIFSRATLEEAPLTLCHCFPWKNLGFREGFHVISAALSPCTGTDS